ncbi:DUF6958 family protein [Pseudooceanicola sp. LIPI14-2-Ac024]|uniref:DUF6958 family protein n=1 Tax=Pseudooceanicola sp. LIPI14-2-Ac024 TaxID=3344875 RepID=UPI0035CF3F24
MAEKIEVENVNHPGRVERVDAAKYAAMHRAVLAALPPGAGPLTVAELRTALDPHLSQDHFPGGATAGWWLKCVHLDLEAKGVLQREARPPVRLSRPPGR